MRILCLLTLGLCSGLIQAATEDYQYPLTRSYGRGKWWMDQPYADDSYNSRVQYNRDVVLSCDNETFMADPSRLDYWILPDLTIMRPGQNITFHTLDGEAGWEVDLVTRDMHITLVQESHFGFYHCHVTTDDGEVHVAKRALNYKGPYFTDLWDKYWLNTVIGLSAAGGLLLIILCLWVVYELRYVEEEQEGEDGEEGPDPEVGEGEDKQENQLTQNKQDEKEEQPAAPADDSEPLYTNIRKSAASQNEYQVIQDDKVNKQEEEEEDGPPVPEKNGGLMGYENTAFDMPEDNEEPDHDELTTEL